MQQTARRGKPARAASQHERQAGVMEGDCVVATEAGSEMSGVCLCEREKGVGDESYGKDGGIARIESYDGVGYGALAGAG